MKVSIIIPAYNEEKLLAGTLAAVRGAAEAFTGRGWRTELIVCDNHSTDRTAEIARTGGATVVYEPVNQIGRARNRGASVATGDWYLFMDADCLPSHELFGDAAGAMESERVLAGGATLRIDESIWWARLAVKAWGAWSRLMGHMAGSFIFVEAAAFREIGGFSPHLYAGEEIDLSYRLRKQARRRRRRIEILNRHPLLTSGRKLQLYSLRESIGFVLRVMLRPRRVLGNPDECQLWYDGRR